MRTSTATDKSLYSMFLLITFCVSRRRSEMYCGHARLCVCVCVCLSAVVRPHYCTDPDVTWGRGRGCHLVVHYLADLQSVHGCRCYDNIALSPVCPAFCCCQQVYDINMSCLGMILQVRAHDDSTVADSIAPAEATNTAMDDRLRAGKPPQYFKQATQTNSASYPQQNGK